MNACSYLKFYGYFDVYRFHVLSIGYITGTERYAEYVEDVNQIQLTNKKITKSSSEFSSDFMWLILMLHRESKFSANMNMIRNEFILRMITLIFDEYVRDKYSQLPSK